MKTDIKDNNFLLYTFFFVLSNMMKTGINWKEESDLKDVLTQTNNKKPIHHP